MYVFFFIVRILLKIKKTIDLFIFVSHFSLNCNLHHTIIITSIFIIAVVITNAVPIVSATSMLFLLLSLQPFCCSHNNHHPHHYMYNSCSACCSTPFSFSMLSLLSLFVSLRLLLPWLPLQSLLGSTYKCYCWPLQSSTVATTVTIRCYK